MAAAPLPFLTSQLVQPSAAHRYVMNSHTSVAELSFPPIQHLGIIILTSLPVLLPAAGSQHSKERLHLYIANPSVPLGERPPGLVGGEVIFKHKSYCMGILKSLTVHPVWGKILYKVNLYVKS